MHIDPRIRDYVFLPLCILMLAVQLLRILGMRYMNEPKNPQLLPAAMSFATLRQTLFELDADMSAQPPAEQLDICKVIEEGDSN